jgi:uncharacterized protein YidB (DUF937 family)
VAEIMGRKRAKWSISPDQRLGARSVTYQDLGRKDGSSNRTLLRNCRKFCQLFVDKLTPQGRVPTGDEIARFAA